MQNSSNGNGYDPNGMASFGMSSSSNAKQPAPSPDHARLQRSLGETEERRRFNASDYLRLLWKGKWIIAACVAVAALLTAYYTYSLPFIYEASIDIAVNERENNPVFSNSQIQSMYGRDRALKNELQFMTSLDVYRLTAARLVKQRALDPEDPRFRDSTIPMIAAAEIALRKRLERVPPERRNEMLVEYIAEAVKAVTVVTPAKDADIISVTTRSGDPREAALITNAYAEEYTDYSRERNRERVKTLEAFLDGKLDTTRQMLSKAEIALKSYQEQVGAVTEALDGAALATQRNNLEQRRSVTSIEISTIRRELGETKSQLASIEPTYAQEMALALPEKITNLTQRLARAEMKYSHVTSLNPRRGSEVAYQRMVGELKKAVDDARAELSASVEAFKQTKLGSLPQTLDARGGPTAPLTALKSEIFQNEIKLSSLLAELAAINGEIASLTSAISQVPENSMTLNRLNRDKTGLENTFIELNQKYNEVVIDKNALLSTVKIVSPAPINTNPISPNRRANLMLGLIIGFGLGVGVVLLIAYADTTIHSPDELSEKGFAVLAAIPAIESTSRPLARKRDVPNAKSTGSLSPHLITFSDPDSPITESYRSLRTAIQFASIVEPIRMLLITSSVPQEGKSTTSANLAIVMANSGLRTVLVDCDLRRPIAHANFGMPKEPGLVNALIGETTLDQAIRSTGIPNLSVLSSGSIPPNPSELLGSKRMSDLLHQLRDMYDLVLIDSPPVGVVTDGVILSTKVDATVVVVRAHRTRMEFLERTNDEVSRVSGPLLGVVLNEFDASQSYGSSYKYYRYYKYYGYYGSKEGDGERKRRRAKVAKSSASATN